MARPKYELALAAGAAVTRSTTDVRMKVQTNSAAHPCRAETPGPSPGSHAATSGRYISTVPMAERAAMHWTVT